MGRSRAKITQWTQVLDRSPLPMFVLDEDRRIVFWNAACAEWTGVSAAAMLGQQCVYQAPDSPPDAGPAAGAGSVSAAPAALASGLCPPPEVFSGHRRRVPRSCIAADDRLLNRWIDYLPLSDGGDCQAPVLALADAAESNVVSSPEPTGEDLHQQLVAFRRQFSRRFVPDRFVGQHPAIQLAREQAALAARSGTNVLIVGPAGSGKEHLGRSIYSARSLNDNASLLPLACGTLPGELLWSTIQAWADNEARAPAGRISTLLLNDVDQLPAEVQPDLVEFLAAKREKIQVIGTATGPLDANRSESALRPDLVCRLSTLVIQLPPLSHHLGDLPLLTQALLEAINAAGDKQVAGFTPEALDVLAGYTWPGNIDELTALVAEAHARAVGLEIGPRDLPKRLHLAADAALNPQRQTESIVLEEFLARMERELIERALRQAKGNKSRAAKLLGLTRPRLYRRMVQLGLEPPAAGQPPAT